VSVCGTITRCLARGFSWQHGIGQFASSKTNPRRLSALTKARICLRPPPTGLNRHFHSADDLPSCVPPSLKRQLRWYRNINLFSIAYAFRPRLRDRLTLRRLTLLRKPWVFGERVSRPLYRYLCQHGLLSAVHRSFRSGFVPRTTLPYRSVRRRIPRLRQCA
jgi:hypothetical protein